MKKEMVVIIALLVVIAAVLGFGIQHKIGFMKHKMAKAPVYEIYTSNSLSPIILNKATGETWIYTKNEENKESWAPLTFKPWFENAAAFTPEIAKDKLNQILEITKKQQEEQQKKEPKKEATKPAEKK
jgi:hypothetical protein